MSKFKYYRELSQHLTFKVVCEILIIGGGIGAVIIWLLIFNYKAPTNIISSPLLTTGVAANPSDCQPVRSGLKQPPMEALFLTEPTPKGLEGFITKKSNNGQSTFSLSTNRLPHKSGDYYLWTIVIDKNGNVCKSNNIGPLVQENKFGTWTISFDQSSYTDDWMIIVITDNGFGKLPTDELKSPRDPNIILNGSFSEKDRVKEINLDPTPSP